MAPYMICRNMPALYYLHILFTNKHFYSWGGLCDCSFPLKVYGACELAPRAVQTLACSDH